MSEISVRTYNKIGAVASYLPTKFEAVSRKPAGPRHTISQKQSQCGCDLQSPLPPPSADFAQLHLKSGEFLVPADTDPERLTMLIPNCTWPLKLLTQWTSPAISHRRATRFHRSKVVTCSPAPGNVRNWTYSSYVSGGVQMSTSHN